MSGVKNAKDHLVEITDSVHKDLTGTDDLFVCFDDLDRKSESLSIEEFSGFVNLLTESNVKVLTICNENKVLDFTKYKEKIVGITIPFRPDAQTLINAVINGRYPSSAAMPTVAKAQSGRRHK